MMPGRADQYGDLLRRNEILLQRLRGICPLDEATLLALGVTGPLLRAAGNPWDLRKATPYSSYDDFDFKIPVGTVGDNYDRFAVRLAEIYESVKIIEQALDGLPEGPHITDDRKIALPPRHELATSMEALIHHFKLVTEGFRVPPGEVYYPIEGPRGELGCFVRSDGSSKPARVHMRDPSFVNLQATAPMVARLLHRRPDRDARDARPDPRGDRPVSAVRRFEHGSRVPGWDEAADLDKDPAGDPRPRARRRARRAARRDRGARWRATPTATRPRCRRSPPPSAMHGWCSPRGDRAGRLRDAPDARLPDLGRDLLRHVRARARSAATRSTSARTSPARCAAPTSSTPRIEEAAGDDPDINLRRFECLGACDIAPMVSVDQRLLRPARARPTRARLVEDLRAGREPLPELALALRPTADPNADTA